MLSAQDITAGTGIVAVIAAAGAIWAGLRGVKNQLWLQMFGEYTRRYSEIVRDLPYESRRPKSGFDPAQLDGETRNRLENAVRAYLNLCSEEYYLYLRGRIDKETWTIWRRGIEETIRLPWITTAWGEVRVEYAYFPEFLAFLDDCVRAEETRPRLTQRSTKANPASL
jgi:hypothetical protein